MAPKNAPVAQDEGPTLEERVARLEHEARAHGWNLDDSPNPVDPPA